MALFGNDNTVDPSALAAVPLFRDISDANLARIARLADRREVSVGETFIEQGRVGTACYVIASGTANVYIGGSYITSLPAGAAVGEMALLQHTTRSATVVAETDMVLAEFGIKDFRKMLEANGDAEQRIMAILNARLAENKSRS